MRRVLIICYDFPWASMAGVIRTYQFAKRLPEFGWTPIILTAQSRGTERVDDIEVSDGPLSCPEYTAAAAPVSLPMAAVTAFPQPSLYSDKAHGDGPIKRTLGVAARFAVPDGKIAWIQPAVTSGLKIALDYPLHACFSVSPRPTAHLAAHRLARRLKIPWIADFALPWSDAYWIAGRPRMVQWLDERVEKWVVKSASKLTVAYEDIARSLRARFGEIVAEKIAVVPTGFDEDLFAQASTDLAAKFTVVYPGNHFCEQGRNGEAFLEAVDQWIDDDLSLEQNVEFVFIGKPDRALQRYRAALRHSRVIRMEPFMSHRACVQAILSAHLCVVNTVGNRIPAKVYECMRAGKWILALTNSNADLANLMRAYPKGISRSVNDAAGIRQALQHLWQRGSVNHSLLASSDTRDQRYSARQSAGKIGRIFDELLLRPPPRPLNVSSHPSSL